MCARISSARPCNIAFITVYTMDTRAIEGQPGVLQFIFFAKYD
jgi:hypothetical protein